MDTYTLVRPEHLNHFGNLFGGQLLKWVDEFAWLVATREFPGCTFVTRAMQNVEFRHQVTDGAILRFHCELAEARTTSVHYVVTVYAQAAAEPEEQVVFRTQVSFVNIDEGGQKSPVKK